jgi:hypothetical protein
MSNLANYKLTNYGYVPFWGFQYFIILLITLSIVFYRQINSFLDNLFGNVNEKQNIDSKETIYLESENNYNNVLKFIILSIPMLLYIYYDTRYASFSLYNLGIRSQETQRILNYLLLVLGSYGIIQVLSQDFGLKTGEVQRDIWHNYQPLTFLLYVGTAYAFSGNRSQSIFAGFLYFHLKYVISNNKTSSVCFEDI